MWCSTVARQTDHSEQNRAFFKARDAQLLEDLDHIAGTPAALVPSPSGHATLCIGDTPFHDPDDPLSEAKAMVGNNPSRLHIHFGFGLGYFLEAEQALPDGQILIFEPNPEFVRQAFRYRPLEKLFKHRSVRLFVAFDRFIYACIKHRTCSPAYRLFVSGHHAAYFTRAFAEFQKALQRPPVLPPIAEIPIMPQILQSTISSMPHYVQSPGFQHWRGLLQDRPAVVVASGPSLEKNVAELAANRHKVIIFAIARSVPILAEYGIAPDFLVHVEAQNYHYLIENCPNLQQTTFLLADQAQEAFYRFPHKDTFVFSSRALRN